MRHRLLITSSKDFTVPKRIIGVMIVMISILFTYLLWTVMHESNHIFASQRLERDTDSFVDQVELRMEVYAEALYSGRALFLVNPSLSREEWEVFTQSQNLVQRYPGLNNIGYVKAGSASDAAAIQNSINRSLPDGVSPVEIYPKPLTDDIAIVSFLSNPGTGQGLGLNAFARPYFADVIERAGVSGVPSASEPYDSRIAARAGTKDAVVMLAIYDGSYRDELSDAEKKAAVDGYIFTSVHPETIFEQALAALVSRDEIELNVKDSSGKPFYSSDKREFGDEKLSRNLELSVGGQAWVAEFTASHSYRLTPREQLAPTVFLAGGVLFMVILTSLYFYKNGVRITKAPTTQKAK